MEYVFLGGAPISAYASGKFIRNGYEGAGA